MLLIFLFLGLFLLFIINGILFFCLFKFYKKTMVLLGNEKKRNYIKELFSNQEQRNKKIEEKIEDLFSRVKNLQRLSERTIQKMGVLRFNPFNEIGGNQSFIISLLDGRDNGVIISGLFGPEGGRVFAKPIQEGKSQYLLSDEERRLLLKTMREGSNKK